MYQTVYVPYVPLSKLPRQPLTYKIHTYTHTSFITCNHRSAQRICSEKAVLAQIGLIQINKRLLYDTYTYTYMARNNVIVDILVY